MGTLLNVLDVAYDVHRTGSGPSIAVDNLVGEIRLWRSLLDNPNAAVEVQIGEMGSSAAVTVDWDGYDPNRPEDRWDPNAAIALGDPNDPNNVHHGNDPNDRIYEVTVCKGDMDNNTSIDFDDIGPFILALGVDDPNDPNNAFAQAFPGLSGCMVYHADCDADGDVDFDDIDPFIALLGQGCTGDGGGAGEMMAPQQLAAGMRAHVPAGRLPALRAFVTQVIAHHADHPVQRAYWQQVRTGLGQ